MSAPQEQIKRQIEQLIDQDIDRLSGRIERQLAKHPEQDFLVTIAKTLGELRRVRIPPQAADRVETQLERLDGGLKRLERTRLADQLARRVREITPPLLGVSGELRQLRNEFAHGMSSPPT